MPTKIDRELMDIDTTYEEVKESTYGIYGYFRHNGECVYIGVDSNINDNLRHKHHMSPSKKQEQEINRYLQSDAMKGITYNVLMICRDKEEMENIETMMILFYKALGQCKFNKAISIDKDI